MTPWTIEKILANFEPITESGCWIYLGCITEHGYGIVKFQGKSFRVHRIFYEHFIGPIPSGLVPDHLCRVRCCVNPYHIEPVTSRTNLIRGHTIIAEQVNRIH